MLRIHWFCDTRCTKRYVYNGLATHVAPNVTYTMVWNYKAHQTLRIHWFGDTLCTKPYVYNGLGAEVAQNVTYTMVWKYKATSKGSCQRTKSSVLPWMNSPAKITPQIDKHDAAVQPECGVIRRI